VAARAAQKTQVLSLDQALAFIERHGIVAESARRPGIVCLADAIAGEPIRGNWWSHPQGREIFAITRAVRAVPQILVCKVVDGKISFVHERLWPALVCLAERFPQERLARVRETHTVSGKHVLEQVPFPEWVPAQTTTAARRIPEPEAIAALAAFAGMTKVLS